MIKLGLFVVLCFLAPWPVGLNAQEQPRATDPTPASDLRHALLGAWAVAAGGGSVTALGHGTRIKFWGLKHWTITEFDPRTGQVMWHHGGTYTLDGDNYTETVTFANDSTRKLIGQTLTFRITVQGDTYIQFGVGNPYNERWIRLKPD